MNTVSVNCELIIRKREGEMDEDAVHRLTSLLDSELCVLADHDISYCGLDEECIYRRVEYNYRLGDARRALLAYIGYDNELLPQEATAGLSNNAGFDIEAALDKNSPSYLLDALVNEFVNIQDCNVAENDTWERACKNILGSMN